MKFLNLKNGFTRKVRYAATRAGTASQMQIEVAKYLLTGLKRTSQSNFHKITKFKRMLVSFTHLRLLTSNIQRFKLPNLPSNLFNKHQK